MVRQRLRHNLSTSKINLLAFAKLCLVFCYFSKNVSGNMLSYEFIFGFQRKSSLGT